MFRVTVKSNFNADRIVEQMTDKAMDHVFHSAQDKVRFLSCPEHGAGVTVGMDGIGKQRTLRISGCCDAIRKKALELIKQRY